MEIEFSERDMIDLQEFKNEVGRERYSDTGSDKSIDRHVLDIPEVDFGTDKDREKINKALEEGTPLPRSQSVKLDPELIEHIKSSFIASGGNLAEISSMYDLTPEAVMRLAVQEEWTIYGGSHKAVEAHSQHRLRALQQKLWVKIEAFLDSMEVEEKDKTDLVQYRTESKYVEALSNRNSAFKNLLDQYMRIGAILEPELYGNDPDNSNGPARKAQEESHPGGIEGLNREIAEFLSDVVVGVSDRVREKEMKGYGQIIDARAK